MKTIKYLFMGALMTVFSGSAMAQTSSQGRKQSIFSLMVLTFNSSFAYPQYAFHKTGGQTTRRTMLTSAMQACIPIDERSLSLAKLVQRKGSTK